MPSNTVAEPVPWPPHSVPIDLAEAARAFAEARGREVTPTSGRYRRIVHQLESRPRCVRDVEAAVPVGFLDGVQARGLLGRVEQRDLTLVWIAAGTVLDRILVDHRPWLAVVCSQLDEEQVRNRAPQVPVVALPETTPWGLAAATEEWVDGARRHVEDLAVAAAPEQTGHVLVVDGSLPPDAGRSDLVGVVKNTQDTDWLPDPDLLPNNEGWRSPGLRIPASRTTERDRLSAYVRLHTATPRHPYGFALVRVEVYEDSPVTLDAAAAMAYRLRGTPAYGDPRWTVQLGPMWRAEQVLKAQIPHVIRVLG